MKTALISGIFGQDGSYLAEFLLTQGYRVIGIADLGQTTKERLIPSLTGRIELKEWDILDQHLIFGILSRFKPTEIYNYAAYSSGEGMFDEPVNISRTNGLGVTHILEAIRKTDPKIRFCQASSSEMFGEPSKSPQSEITPFNPRSPYGAAKLYAHNMVRIYREHYNLFVCSAILFNHESPRRGLNFVTKKIVSEAVKIKLGLAGELKLGNLEASRDWGFAGDYVRAMWLMLQQPQADDYVVATGKARSVREFCEAVFGYLGLDYHKHVIQDHSAFRKAEAVQLVGNAKKAKKHLRWSPEVSFENLVKMMVDAELAGYSKK